MSISPDSPWHLAILHVGRAERDCPPEWAEISPDTSPLVFGRAAQDVTGPSWKEAFLSRRHFTLTWQQEHGGWILQRCREEGRLPPNELFHDAARTSPVEEPHVMEPGMPLFLGQKGVTAVVLLRSREDLARVNRQGKARTQRADWTLVTETEGREEQHSDLPYELRMQLRTFQQDLPNCLQAWVERGDATEQALFQEVCGVVLRTIGGGGGGLSAAFLALPADALPRVLHTDTGPFSDFRPSRQVIAELLDRAPGRTILWKRSPTWEEVSLGGTMARSHADWVIALRLPSGSSSSSSATEKQPLLLHGEQIILYMEARHASANAPEPWLPFVRTVGILVASVLEAREQQRIQSQLAAYFSPRLRQVARETPPSALEPAIFNCTVLFCDRRGSSQAAETAGLDAGMLKQLKKNQELLSEVTRVVFNNEGAVADFAGDCVLGFWGWPVDQTAPDHARAALETARQVAEKLRDQRVEDAILNMQLASFRIGVSTGPMAVGNVGPTEQMKIGVFGSPVNFGSRLESLGKQFLLPVIVSEATVNAVNRADFLFRKLCLIRPAGFDQAYPIYELVLPQEHGGSGATPEQVAVYEEALAAFVRREFGACRQKLGALLAANDKAAVWLIEQASHFLRHPPPSGWMGEITMDMK